jgi:hypothetical protein
MNDANDFLPEGYELPKGPYFKPEVGENRIRIIGRPVIGWLDWDRDKKPHRFRMDKKPSAPMGKDPIRHFWAILVWDNKGQCLQVWELTQKGIMAAIKALVADPDWGNPSDYDIKITKSGSGKDTEYEIRPAPKSPMSDEVKTIVAGTYHCLDAIFDGLDPFAPIANG